MTCPHPRVAYVDSVHPLRPLFSLLHPAPLAISLCSASFVVVATAVVTAILAEGGTLHSQCTTTTTITNTNVTNTKNNFNTRGGNCHNYLRH